VRSAVDSNVLLDVLSGSEKYLEGSQSALRQALMEGSLVASDVVWSEVRAHFPSKSEFVGALETLGVLFDPLDADCSELAGETWRRYRREGGPRTRMIPDFLVAAHAHLRADRLLTRDRGFVRRYFPRLKVLDPTAS